MEIFNIHERWLPAEPARAAALLDGLSQPDDRLWPQQVWPAIRFDRGLEVGASGGHGPVHYEVESYEPGRQVSFRFLPKSGFAGHHWFELAPQPGGVLVRHGLRASGGLKSSLVWGLVIRYLHDALVEDALDNAERELTGKVAAPARWSWWVKILRRGMRALHGGPEASAGAAAQ